MFAINQFLHLKKKKKPYPPIQFIRIYIYSIINLNFRSIVISNNIFIMKWVQITPGVT